MATASPTDIEATKEVTIIKLSGSIAFGPRHIDSSFTIEGLMTLFERGRPKIISFGDRRLLQDDTLETLPSKVLLTVTYSSPAISMGPPFEDVLLQSYSVLEKLGRGTYGAVYKASCNRSEGSEKIKVVAVKVVRLENQQSGIPATAIREIALLNALSHPNVVKLEEAILGTDNLYMVMEHADLDLRAYHKACGPFTSLPRLQAVLRMCFEAIAHCHSNGVMHRDIKPQNFLMNMETMQVKLADFDLGRSMTLSAGGAQRQYTHEVVTVWYRAPEILLGSKLYGTPIDIWAMGCVILECATGRATFPGDSEVNTIFLIFKFLGTPNEDVWPGVTRLRDFKVSFPKWTVRDIHAKIAAEAPILEGFGAALVVSCLQYDPSKRTSARHCLQQEYFGL